MRIPIREQLVCFVFLVSGVSLTIIALAIWYTNHKFVLDLR
jgi:osomolarity two-component system sensor histidine kinase SLN1